MKKYFPEWNGVALERLQIHKVGMYSVTQPRDAEDVMNTLLYFIKRTSCDKIGDDITVIDATACVGGDTLSFASKFSKVVSIEKDTETFNMLKNNLMVYNIPETKVLPINADFVELLKNDALPFAVDIIYMDPPWNPPGQPWHSKLEKIMLYLSNMAAHDVVKLALRKTKATTIAVKVPFNFDFRTFVKNMNDTVLMIHSVSSFYIIFCARP
jgi:16S rRNA G966 N2-methylase RsmD